MAVVLCAASHGPGVFCLTSACFSRFIYRASANYELPVNRGALRNTIPKCLGLGTGWVRAGSQYDVWCRGEQPGTTVDSLIPFLSRHSDNLAA